MPATLQRPLGAFALSAFPAAGVLYVAEVIGVRTYVGLSLIAVSALLASLLPEPTRPPRRPRPCPSAEQLLHTH